MEKQNSQEQAPEITNAQQSPVKESIYDAINKPQVETELYLSAKHLLEKFRGNSFSLQQVMKKGKMTEVGAKTLLSMLNLKGLVIYKKESNKYKVTLDPKSQIAGLEAQRAQCEQEIVSITGLIADIKKRHKIE